MFFLLLSLVGFLAGFLLLLLKSDLYGPLSDVPGPFLARITDFWELYTLYAGDYVYKHQALHEKYGHVVRLGPGRYSLDDPAAVKYIYGPSTKFVKSDFYSVFDSPDGGPYDTLFPERDNETHKNTKRRVTSLFTMTALRSYEPFVDELVNEFVERLKGFAGNGEIVNVPEWLQYFAFDVIGKISFSESFGFIQLGKDQNGIVHANAQSMKYLGYVGTVPYFHFFILRISSLLRLTPPILAVLKWVDERLAERQVIVVAEPTARSDFHTKLLYLRQTGKVKDTDIYNTLIANINAGSDSTGAALSSVVWFLAKHPNVRVKLQDELRDFEEAGKLSNPITFAEAQAMPYLQAIIKESMRLHPAVGISLQRKVPAGGVELCGRFFPQGSVVGASAWLINYNKEIFGNDAQNFNPQRWLGDPESVNQMDSTSFSFGAGSRTCIGKNISLLEMSKLIPELYRHFDFELAAPISERTISSNWFVTMDFTCKVKSRT